MKNPLRKRWLITYHYNNGDPMPEGGNDKCYTRGGAIRFSRRVSAWLWWDTKPTISRLP